MSFYNLYSSYNWDEVAASIQAKAEADVRVAIAKAKPGLEDFMALVSPAADGLLEEMARRSYTLTRQKFGKVMHLYIPLYLSNFCENRCMYCGFSNSNRLRRKVLSLDELEQEVSHIRQQPFKHILLVTGEAPVKAGTDYFISVINQLKSSFSQISLEVQPLSTTEYEMLVKQGLYGVYVYQETYNERRYSSYHPAGSKADFRYRLETPDRLGAAGVRKIGIGNLIGLEDWRTEAWFTALHLHYLRKKYWRSKYSISFPRLRPFTGEGFQPNYETTERNLTQLICAYRIFDHEVDLSLSTRERPMYRDNVMSLGITAMSAGSKTGPGGYTNGEELEQFAVNDNRSADMVADAIRCKGYEPVWKDWSMFLQMA